LLLPNLEHDAWFYPGKVGLALQLRHPTCVGFIAADILIILEMDNLVVYYCNSLAQEVKPYKLGTVYIVACCETL